MLSPPLQSGLGAVRVVCDGHRDGRQWHRLDLLGLPVHASQAGEQSRVRAQGLAVGIHVVYELAILGVELADLGSQELHGVSVA